MLRPYVRIAKRWCASAPQQQAHDAGTGADGGERRGDPEGEHAPGEPRLELREPLGDAAPQLGHPLLELRVGLRQALLELGVGFRQALLQLGVEPGEIQLVQLPEISPIRGVHSVEPVHELVRDVLAELLIELLRKYRRDRHRSLHWWPVRNLAASQCPCVTVPLQAGTENFVKLLQSLLGAAAEARGLTSSPGRAGN